MLDAPVRSHRYIDREADMMRENMVKEHTL